MAVLAGSPVTAAVYSALTGDATLAGLVGARVGDDIRQATAFPYLWLEVRESDRSGFGAAPVLAEVELRVHCFSDYRGAKQAQTILARVIEVLRHQTLTVAGWGACGATFYDETVPLPAEDINGVRVVEVVAMFRLHVEAP